MKRRFHRSPLRSILPPPPERPDLDRSVDSLRQRGRSPRDRKEGTAAAPTDEREPSLNDHQAALELWEQRLRARERILLERERGFLEETMLLEARLRQIERREASLKPASMPAPAHSTQELAESDEVIGALELRLAQTEKRVRQHQRRIIELSAELEEATNPVI